MKSSLREVHVTEAVGMVLAHDLTQVVPGRFKGPLFRKGHVIREEDFEALLSIGKEHIYVMELAAGELHENDAACRIAQAVGGPGLTLTAPVEGKVQLVSDGDGLLKVDATRVLAINEVEQAVLSTLKTDIPVKEGEVVAASRVIPLIYPVDRIEQVERIAADGERPVLEVLPFRRLKVGVVTTGSEIYHGRIPDRFGPVIQEKLQSFGSTVMGQTLAGDDKELIQAQIRAFVDRGADLVLVTGGMSVDPDDRTPGAIASLGAEVVSYGTPMLPGSMLMIAYYREIPILGLPGCVIHDEYTSFDLFLPRILTGEKVKREDIVRLGYGGLHSC
ncbi:molybdopterin biosynthesis protein [Kroppenstedtia guangzhouensis]|jgi:molybdenum cofactor synthesis domain-containing protein|uniref:Molybdopterin molybdenumtransferase n=1 Tax=Kroppenstedtia guangzhouensis TaxID=1274356 RepID=A0ABQ1GSC4_9BACL|nr:molybdopterin-binding protein [Kroppenstedtia guangzhouensis]GGA49102.1 molybdopterin biosynthesis protein [Kroppenstedtia guangzhouensis]